MTSEERHEARYQRRKAKREAKQLARSQACGDFDEVFSYENLFQSGLLCARGVAWKHSTQTYRMNMIVNTKKTRDALLDGTFRSKGFVEFDICERGKMRHIRSVHISERVVQRTLCDKAIIPIFSAALIHDNGASLKDKGITFARKRVEKHLHDHYRKYGNGGYVLTFDFSSYFDNANHEPIKKELERRVHDERIRALANYFLDAFGDVGYGLGSQISQIAAIMLPNRLDHMIKEELRIKGYARYMDDGYLIHQDKEYLEHCLECIQQVCDELGIILNPRKTKIQRLDSGFTFLKVKYKLTGTGKILKRIQRKSFKNMRRKLKKFKHWMINGRYVRTKNGVVCKRFTLQEICNSYISWRTCASYGNNYYAVKRMDAYFAKLFGVHPDNKEERRAVFNEKEGILCTESKMQLQAH